MKVLTVDIEDWFHILDHEETGTEAEWASFPSRIDAGVTRILDAFDRHKVKGTFFILGWIARTAPDAVAEIARRGHEIANHSDMHKLVYTMTPQEFETDLLRANEAIEKATGIVPTAYRAPGFSVTADCAWAFEIMARNGFRLDCSVFPASRSHGGIPHFPLGGPCTLTTPDSQTLRCFPINLKTIAGRRLVYSGGGYFRLAPRGLLRRWFGNDPYVMTYFHPRDFDPDQPLVPGLSAARRFKSYVGLRGALPKLETLISENEFVTLGAAEAATDWQAVPAVRVTDFATKPTHH
ncbi:MAG: polysaccharide deacetylase family protein [Paracoccaceae bacterium]